MQEEIKAIPGVDRSIDTKVWLRQEMIKEAERYSRAKSWRILMAY